MMLIWYIFGLNEMNAIIMGLHQYSLYFKIPPPFILKITLPLILSNNRIADSKLETKKSELLWAELTFTNHCK